MPVVVLDAVRTPLGAVHGALAEIHPVELLAHLLRGVAARGRAPVAEARELVAGCVEQVGAQGGNVARAAALAAGWPDTVGGTTLDRGAVSGLAALAHAAALVTAGASPLAVVAAVDSPSLVPPGAAAMGRYPYGRPWEGALDGRPLLPPGRAAERLGQPRSAQDAWAARSIERARAAVADGAFATEVLALPALAADEVPSMRPADPSALAALPPMFDDDGTVTSGNAAPDADGAAVVVLADAGFVHDRGLDPLAVIDGLALRAAAPEEPVAAAVAAADAVGGAAGATSVELPEPCAAVALALVAALGVDDPARLVNPVGGPLGLGDPTATSGLRALVSLVHRLAASSGASGLVVASGLGQGAAVRLRSPR
jgi:acetyl-CoA acyltransferase